LWFEASLGIIVRETLSQKKQKPPKKPSHKRAGGMAQSEGPEFKPQYCQKKKKKTNPGGPVCQFLSCTLMLIRSYWSNPLPYIDRKVPKSGTAPYHGKIPQAAHAAEPSPQDP
jgi:hypothetical protein